MTRVVEAIYTNGHLEPLEQLDLAERERVTLVVQTQPDPSQREAALARLFELMDRTNLRLSTPLPSRDELHERR